MAVRASCSVLAWALASALLGGCTSAGRIAETAAPQTFATAECTVGIYGPPDAFVALTRRGETVTASFSDGRRAEAGVGQEVECGDASVRIAGQSILERRAIAVTDTRFDSGGVSLAGQLLEPRDADAQTPLVVLAHGSEELGWIEAVPYPYQLVGRGVSVFVYDKRGTGASQGTYSQNFPRLADDLVAASREAKRLAAGRYGRFGLMGFSQGGWIVPLAAQRAEAEFLGIGYGLLVDILEEDASQVQLELREAGYGPDVLAKAKLLTDVTARLAVSNYRDGLEELDALRDRFAKEPWFPVVKGGFSGVLLGMSTQELREDGIPMFDRLDIDWSVKPMDALRPVQVPQLWILAEDDREAPVDATLDRLRALREEGRPITIAMYPDTDHGMWEFEQASDGSRTYTRIVETYYDMLADWAKGSLAPAYGDSERR